MALLRSRNSEQNTSDNVVKIVLFVVTGAIITFFATMVLIGIIRAYRHQARYMPENVAGQPRFDRAKEITRAILDTIPIIRFFDDGRPQPMKDAETPPLDQINAKNNSHDRPDCAIQIKECNDKFRGVDAILPTKSHSNHSIHDEGTLRCSICTEDYSNGEQVRVLPCNHRYHPTCIDPWLLNMSGTCPLCRRGLTEEASLNILHS